MAKNLRCDTELVRETRVGGIMYSALIPVADQQDVIDANEGVSCGTFLEITNLEAGEREIYTAQEPTGAVLPLMVTRGEVNYSEATLSDGEWGKFRVPANKPLPVVQLTKGDFIALSQDFFPALPTVGQIYNLDANFIAGTQLVAGTYTAGTASFEVVEVKDSGSFHHILGDGTLLQAYKMVCLRVLI